MWTLPAGGAYNLHKRGAAASAIKPDVELMTAINVPNDTTAHGIARFYPSAI